MPRGFLGIKVIFKWIRIRNVSTVAHLIQSSSDKRFTITYAVKNISEEEIRSANFSAVDYDVTMKKYNPDVLKPGWNAISDGEQIFYISNPALGLWIDKNRF